MVKAPRAHAYTSLWDALTSLRNTSCNFKYDSVLERRAMAEKLVAPLSPLFDPRSVQMR
jgi:hypothetical protein